MARTMKSAANATGRTLLGVLKLLVLSSWIGGGLVVGGLIWQVLPAKFEGDQAKAIIAYILAWFSIAMVIAGGALSLLVFLLERKARGGMFGFVTLCLLTVLTAVNKFIIIDAISLGTLHPAFVSIFIAQIGIALIFMSVMALAGKAAPALPVPPSGAPAAPVIAPLAVPQPAQPAASSPISPPPPAMKPPPEQPAVARPGAGSPPFAQPSSAAAPPAAPGKPTSLPVQDPAIDVLLGEGEPEDPPGGQERS